MGKLVNGTWSDQWYDTKSTGGKFVREDANFRNFIGDGAFPAESNRYHLYVSLACPWAHRTLIFRQIKGLEKHISVSVVHPHMMENGWELKSDFPGATGDHLYGKSYLWEIYTKAKKDYTGRVTVPVLWDKQTETIVSNESSDIIRMMNTEFNAITGNTLDFYPREHQKEIDEINTLIYNKINNGVYKAGFATEQDPYEKAVSELFETLDTLEKRLRDHGPYLLGDTLTEADWRLFTTLLRFDPVYVGHFKCNLQRIKDYKALQNYLETLIHYKDVKTTIDYDHIKHHYYYSHHQINPTRIVPLGPRLNNG